MRFRWVALALLLAGAGQAMALGKIRIVSDVPAYVELKGQKLGEAPLTLHDLKRGTYELVITAFDTGETKIYKVSIPGKTTVTRNVNARFDPASRSLAQAATAREPRIAARFAPGSQTASRLGAVPEAQPASSDAALPPRPFAASPPPSVRTSRLIASVRSRFDRTTQRHLVAGGVALLGAAMGSGVVAGLGLGGVVMNEVVKRDRDPERSRAISRGWGPPPAR